MSEQYIEAFKRAGWLGIAAGLFVGLLTGFGSYASGGNWATGVYAGLAAMGVAIVGRGGIEGKIDTSRADGVKEGRDELKPSDVGYHLAKDALQSP